MLHLLGRQVDFTRDLQCERPRESSGDFPFHARGFAVLLVIDSGATRVVTLFA